MFAEIAGATGCAVAISILRSFRDKDINRIKFLWDMALIKCNIQGIKNKDAETFSIDKIKRESYGYSLKVPVPLGLSAETLYKSKEILQDNLKCLVEFDKKRFSDCIKVKLITKIINNKEFEPVKTKEYELFLGHLIDGTPYIIDLNKDPHLLFAGKTGTGKSFLFASVLTNLIYNNQKDIDIYLFQVMKGEIDIFKKCKPVKFTSDNKQEILIMLKKLSNIIHNRSKTFAASGIKNITQWNKHHKKNKMKRIIVAAEEISFFMEKADDKDNPYFKYFTNIVKAGRSAGVHFIGLTQRTTAANLSTELKAQMTIITSKQRSELDSRNAIDIGDAVNLEEKEWIASGNDGYVWFKAPSIDEDFSILNKFVSEIVIPCSDHSQQIQKNNCINQTIDVSNYKSLELNRRIKENEKKGIKTTIIDLTKKKQANNTIILSERVENTSKIKPNAPKSKKAIIPLEVLENASGER